MLEDIIKKALSLSPIFSIVKLRPSRVKFTITTIIISNATLYLILNYNGKGSYSKELSILFKTPSS